MKDFFNKTWVKITSWVFIVKREFWKNNGC